MNHTMQFLNFILRREYCIKLSLIKFEMKVLGYGDFDIAVNISNGFDYVALLIEDRWHSHMKEIWKTVISFFDDEIIPKMLWNHPFEINLPEIEDTKALIQFHFEEGLLYD